MFSPWFSQRSPRLIAVVVAIVAISFPEAIATAREPDEVLVRGKEFVIKQRDLDEMWHRIETENMNFGRIIPPDEVEFRQATLLDQMIFSRIAMSHASDEERARAKARADKGIAEIKEQLGTEANFRRQIARSGMDDETFRAFKLEEATVLEVVERAVKSKIEIQEADLRKYYQQSAENFAKPETFRVVHLLVSTRNPATGEYLTTEQRKEKRRLAEALRVRVQQGEDLSQLARKHSDDGASRPNGGETTFVSGRIVVEFEAAAAALQPGQLSDVVETQFGYHLIKLLDHRPPATIPFEEAEKDIRELLVGRELQRRIGPWAEQLQKEANLEFTSAAPRKKAGKPKAQ